MNQIVLTQPQEVSMSNGFDRYQLDLIKSMYFKGSTDDEFNMFIHVCKKTGLDPALRQIHPVKRWDSKLKREVMTVQTGIDGYRLIAERTGRYAPGREPTYQYTKEGQLLSATAYVKKQTADGTWHEIAATAFFNEYCQRDKEGKPNRFWTQMAHNQLAKCAESLALRKAFPGDLSGIYTKEEMEQSETISVEAEQKTKQETINSEQAEELSNIIADCDPNYQKKVIEYLKKNSVETFDQLPSILYDRVRNAAIKNRDEYILSQQQTEMAMGE